MRYRFETESDTREDTEVMIMDEESGETLAKKRLYGITEAEIDIAPYLRREMERTPYILRQTGFAYAHGAMTVSVDAGGGKSEPRRVFRAEYDPSKAAMMTVQPMQRTIALGETEVVTLYAPRMLEAVVETEDDRGGTVRDIYMPTDATPCEFFLRTDDLPESTRSISVMFYGDDELLGCVEYTVVERPQGAQRVMWYNRTGGLECYTYPVCRVTEAEAEVTQTATEEGVTARLTDGGHRLRLTSAYETREQYDALHEV